MIVLAEEGDEGESRLEPKELAGDTDVRATEINASDARVGLKKVSQNGVQVRIVAGSRGPEKRHGRQTLGESTGDKG